MELNVGQKNVFHPVTVTYTTAGGYCDLYGVAPRLTHLLQVQGLVRGFVVTPFNAQRSCIDTDLIVGGEKWTRMRSGHMILFV